MDMNAAMHVKTPEEAAAWFDAALAEMREKDPLHHDDKHREILLSNLGYFAGYYGHETRLRVEELYGTRHPFLGKAAETGQLPPEKILEIGLQHGRAWRAQEEGKKHVSFAPPAEEEDEANASKEWPVHGLLKKPWRNVSGLLAVRDFPDAQYNALSRAVEDLTDQLLRTASANGAIQAELLLASARVFAAVYARLGGDSDEMFEAFEETVLVTTETKFSLRDEKRVLLDIGPKKGTNDGPAPENQ